MPADDQRRRGRASHVAGELRRGRRVQRVPQGIVALPHRDRRTSVACATGNRRHTAPARLVRGVPATSRCPARRSRRVNSKTKKHRAHDQVPPTPDLLPKKPEAATIPRLVRPDTSDHRHHDSHDEKRGRNMPSPASGARVHKARRNGDIEGDETTRDPHCPRSRAAGIDDLQYGSTQEPQRHHARQNTR